ncbi:hypothetical protein [Ruegeria marina]|uniref:Secreted protein n=1 Tax=Ruegeria marina TaxID=639004 RepID=A0A1G6RY54_9RHOB|nr:hypothetical protein [Ruegeria marina]SDD09351.1 hypothetical protein SAMN04488239_105103 [Ruegeria marina]
MKRFLTGAVCAALMSVTAPAQVFAATGGIHDACRQSGRSEATPQRCSCIQQAANKSLTRSDRRKVAKWFRDPHQAQEVRMSDKRSDEALWKRYKAFGELAQAICQ